MELVIIVLMILGGLGIAISIGLLASASSEPDGRRTGSPRNPGVRVISAAILGEIASRSGVDPALVSHGVPVGPPVVPKESIDLTSWAENFSARSSRQECEALLEEAVRTAMRAGPRLKLSQYYALVELSFGLGFRADALWRLRDRYGFDYTDWAKHRPREQSGSTEVMTTRERTEELLLRLGLPGGSTRREIVTAYRKLATLYHPDRFHGASAEEVEAASRRFREVHNAYQALVGIDRSDCQE